MLRAQARSALLYLATQQLRNRVMRVFRQIRNTRYALAAVVGILYFAGLILSGRSDTPLVGERSVVVIAFLLALFLGWSWLWGGRRRGLALAPAEAHMLLTAPIDRRTILVFKLIRQLAAGFVSAALLTALAGNAAPGWWLRLPAYTLLLWTLTLHQLAASLVHASATEHGRAGLRWNRVAIVVFAVAAAVLVFSVASAIGEMAGSASPEHFMEVLRRALEQELPSIVLLPFRWVLGPLLATDISAWLRALPAALLVLAAHIVWVFRAETASEEAMWEATMERARHKSHPQQGRSPIRSFRLSSHGHPAVALAWKNLVQLRRRVRTTPLLFIAFIWLLAFLPLLFRENSPLKAVDAMAVLCAGIGVAFFVFGPLAFRNDLRADLAKLALLRTYPLSGRAIVAAEILGCAIAVSLVQLLLFSGMVFFQWVGGQTARAIVGTALFPVLLLALLTVNAVTISVHNAFALFFPRWASIGEERSGGFEQTGLHLLTIVGALLITAIVLIPGVLLGVAVVFLLEIGLLTAALSVLAALPPIWFETMLIFRLLGRVLERTDPVAAGV